VNGTRRLGVVDVPGAGVAGTGTGTGGLVWGSRLRLADVLPLGAVGLRSRRGRAALSVLGIAIGIASLVAVLGITASSQADLVARIDQLGTNLLTVANGLSLGNDEVPLPRTATPMISRVGGVTAVAPTADLAGVHAYRTDLIPAHLGGSITVRACDSNLLATLDARLATGRFIDPANRAYPVAVLGAYAAHRLGVTAGHGPVRIWLTGHWFAVAGILQPAPLAPEIDRSVLVGFPVAASLFGHDGHPTRIYVRADTEQVPVVATELARATNPITPNAVMTSRPSDALTARLAVAGAGTGLFLGLGAVALGVGGIGIANILVIAVLERRAEIGLRRAVGARRIHVATQFITEAFLLGLLGGASGVALGVVVTAAVARDRGWALTVPAFAAWGGVAVAIGIALIAGSYPAARAARLAPTDALRTP
jgi:putative ABC transport system permease protein